MSITKHPHLFYLTAIPTGHAAVDWISAGLYLLAPAMSFGNIALSPAQIGLMFTIRSAASSMFYIPAGIISDSTRRQGPLMIAAILWVGVAGVIASLVPNYWLFILALALGTSGSTSWHPLAMAAIVNLMPKKSATAMAIHGIGGTASEALGPLTVGFLLAVLSWRHVLLINSLIPIALAVVIIKIIHLRRQKNTTRLTSTDFKELVKIGKQPAILGLLLAMALYNMSNIAMVTMFPVYLKEVREFSPQLAGVIFAALLIAGVIGALVVGLLSDKFGRRSVTMISMIVGGLCLWSMTLMPNTISLATITMVAGFFLIAVRNVLTAAALDVVGQREATVIGILFAFGEGIGALGSLIGGVIAEVSVDWALIFSAILAFCVAGLVSILSLDKLRINTKPHIKSPANIEGNPL